MVLVGIWMQNYRNGFAWSWSTEEPGVLFNWHPLFMTIGLIYLYGNGKIYAVILKLHSIINVFMCIYICSDIDFFTRNISLSDAEERKEKVPKMVTFWNHDALLCAICYCITSSI